MQANISLCYSHTGSIDADEVIPQFIHLAPLDTPVLTLKGVLCIRNKYQNIMH